MRAPTLQDRNCGRLSFHVAESRKAADLICATLQPKQQVDATRVGGAVEDRRQRVARVQIALHSGERQTNRGSCVTEFLLKSTDAITSHRRDFDLTELIR